jgi:hypothetical protein
MPNQSDYETLEKYKAKGWYHLAEIKQKQIDDDLKETAAGNKSSSCSEIKRKKNPGILAIGMLIICSFIVLFIILKPAPQNVINNETLIREVLKKIQTMEEPLPINEKEYHTYGIGRGDTPEPNCVDYSFAFAAFYGPAAKIIFNDHHCWIKIGSVEIEPQQDPQDPLKNIAADRGMNYLGTTRVFSLKEKHRNFIKEAMGF